MKRAAAAAMDVVLIPFAALFGPVAMIMARLAEKAPLSRRVLDAFGVALVRHHYYFPLVMASDLHKPLSAERSLPGLDLNPAGQLALVSEFRYADELRAFPLDDPGDGGFFFQNASFEQGDAEVLYDMVRHFKPSRIVEIGSGHSTRIARAAILKNADETPGYQCVHTCVEPYEMPWLAQYEVNLIRERVELVDDQTFDMLEAGDILFIDSSHCIRPQGDVVHELLHLLPKIKSGVIVHIHDIFTPYDYPETWVLDRRLMWDEQYLLEAFLTCNKDFEVIAAVNWLWRNHAGRMADAAPNLVERPEHQPGSFWLRRR